MSAATTVREVRVAGTDSGARGRLLRLVALQMRQLGGFCFVSLLATALRRAVCPSLVLALAACGGGGSGATPPAAGIDASPLSPSADRVAASSTLSSPAPTSASATTSTTASSGNVATYHGCSVFTAGDYYNAPVTTAAVDPNSAAYITSVWRSGDTAGFYASTGIEQANLASSSTPLLTVHQQVSYHSFPVPYPWTSGFYIEPAGDKHSMVVQTQSCHLYEAYGTTYSGSTLSAYSGANWDLTKAFVPLPPNTPSSMASGLSLFAGMVKWEDYQSGAIRHALNWAAIAHTVSYKKFVRPASDTDHLPFNGASYDLPYGAHLRLKASFSTAGWGPQAQMVAQAMKTYGIYLADTGSSGNAIYFGDAPGGTNPWNWSDLSVLSHLHVTDFEVLTLPPVQTLP
jgi:hypothetical protein